MSKSTSRAGEQHEVGSLALTTEEGWEGGLINNRGIESKLDSRKSGDVSTGLVEGRSEDHKNEIYFPCDVAAHANLDLGVPHASGTQTVMVRTMRGRKVSATLPRRCENLRQDRGPE